MRPGSTRTLAVLGLMLCTVGYAHADASLSELDAKRLEVAKQTRTEQIEQAKEAYQQALKQADENLRETYTTLIKSYEDNSDTATADSLRAEMKQTLGDSETAATTTPAAQAQAPADQPPVPTGPHGDLIAAIGSELVKADGSKVNPDYLANQKYVLVYFSAEWCGPCRAFTPKLVDFYNANHKDGDFEVVFYSSDRDEGKMFHYMQTDKMPWVAVPYDHRKASGIARKYAGRGIPCLVMIGPDGKVVSDSFVDGPYVGPRKVMSDLAEKLGG